MLCDNFLDSLGIEEGERLFISSDSRKLLYKFIKSGTRPDLNTLIDGMISRLGKNGTLLFPTYNWDFCEGISFDYHRTSCRTGLLGTTALKRSDFKRTTHPIYSFAVWGKDQEYLCNLNNIHSFGPDSPFAYLHKNNVKNIMIDVDYQRCFTFVHYVEEQTSDLVPYRYHKTFRASYIDSSENETERDYSMFVRDYDLNTEAVVNPIGEILEQKGISKKYVFDGITVRILRLGDAFPIIQDDIVNNRSRNLCSYIGRDD